MGDYHSISFNTTEQSNSPFEIQKEKDRETTLKTIIHMLKFD